MLQQRAGDDLDDDVVDADLKVRIKRINLATHFGRAIHLNFSRQKEMRYRSKGSDQSSSDGAPDFANWLITIRGGAEGYELLFREFLNRAQMPLARLWWSSLRGLRLIDCSFNIAFDNTAPRASATKRAQIH